MPRTPSKSKSPSRAKTRSTTKPKAKSKSSSGKSVSGEDGSSSSQSDLVHSKIFPQIHSTPDRSWFSLGDVFYRCCTIVVLFYYLLLTRPISMITYSWKYNNLWYSYFGPIMTLLIVIQPFNYAVAEIVKNVLSVLAGHKDFDADSIFFVAPKNPISSFLWQFLKEFSVYVANFMICRTHPDAIAHTWYDWIMDKYFWRDLLDKSGAKIPKDLGRFKNGELTMFEDIEDTDVVLKIPDSYLGIGDQFLEYGTDFTTPEDLETLIKSDKQYDGKELLVIDWIRPKEEMGVHQFDILTINSADEGFKVFNVILWTDCTGASSHTCRAGYLVDVETETITGSTPWYSAYFVTQKTPLVGTKVPGVKKACEAAINAHKEHAHSWCRVIGWDCMINRKGVPVFFEGNLAAHRTPRRVCLHHSNAASFVKALAPLGNSEWFLKELVTFILVVLFGYILFESETLSIEFNEKPFLEFIGPLKDAITSFSH